MEARQYYSYEEVFPGVFRCVEEYYSPAHRANIWVIRGSDLDVVVDAGLGLWNVREYLEQNKLIGLQGKPCLAVATHIHFDHTGGLHQFDDVAIHEAEAEYLRRGDNSACLTIVRGSTVSQAPQGFNGRKYKVQAVQNIARVLSHGDKIDLGDVVLRVIHAPGHSEGSIMLFDDTRGFLFSGDVIYDGTLFDHIPNSNVDTYRNSLTNLLEMSDSIAHVFPGHFDGFNKEKMRVIALDYVKMSDRLMHRLHSSCMRCVIGAYFGGRSNNLCRKTCHYSSCCCFLRCIYE